MLNVRRAGFWLALLGAAPLASPVLAQTHMDKNGTVIQATAPIFLYDSAGASQFIAASTLASVTSLTAPSGATVAEICVETAGVRYRDDGTAPTASVGIPIFATSSAPTCFQYAGPLGLIQFIAVSGSPTMDVSYYKAN